MMRHLAFAIGLCTFLLISTEVLAQDVPEPVSAGTCRGRIEQEIRKEHLLYRSMLYGQSTAEDARIMEQRYASDESYWYKWDGGQWRSQSEGYEGTTWSDTLMDDMMNPPPRKGIFETKGVLTTELIPYIGQSVRALDCRLKIISEWAWHSIGATEGQRLRLQAPGCLQDWRLPLPECQLAEAGSDQAEGSDVTSYSKRVGKDLFEQELALTLMAVHYDAAYRSMLQFAGNMDNALRDLSWPLFTTLRRTVDLVSHFSRIPCFLSSCDAYPPPSPAFVE